MGEKGSSFIIPSEVGRSIKKVINRFQLIEPKIKILQYSIMPDHVHILLFVVSPTEDILGRIMARFKIEVNNDAGLTGIFTKGFNDQILKPSRSLDVLYRYIRENPRRLAVRRLHPEYFRRVNMLTIGGKSYQAYGNMQLLECPFREQVVVHRADSEDARAHNRGRWLYTAANGGVLVSPFISPAEKSVREEADDLGGRFILIVNEPMGERYKPSGRDFELCEAGRMLIVSAGHGGEISRGICLAMNGIAAELAAVS